MRITDINRLIIGHLNVNKIDTKFESLKNIIEGNLDMFVLSETKLDDSYPTHEFNVEGYQLPFRHDRNAYGGGIRIYVKEGIPWKELKNLHNPKDFEGIFLEINLKKSKWLFEGYNNKNANIKDFLNRLATNLDQNMGKLDNFLLMGDFNCKTTEITMMNFCHAYNVKNLITDPTCFKNPLNPIIVQLWTRMTISVMKTFFPKQAPKVIKYRDYKFFNDENFRRDLQTHLVYIGKDAD